MSHLFRRLLRFGRDKSRPRRTQKRVVLESLEGRPLLSAGAPATAAQIQVLGGTVHERKVSVTLTTDQVTRVYGQNVVLFARLKRSDTGVRMPGEPVKFSIDGDYVGTARVDSFGNYAKLSLTAAQVAKYHVGTHTITAKYDGNASFHGAQATNKYIVYQSNPTIMSRSVAAKTGTTVVVTATMTDRYTSAPLAGRRIEVSIDDRPAGTYTTDAAGAIRFSYKIPTKFAHLVKFVFKGDVDYRAGTGSAAITGT